MEIFGIRLAGCITGWALLATGLTAQTTLSIRPLPSFTRVKVTKPGDREVLFDGRFQATLPGIVYDAKSDMEKKKRESLRAGEAIRLLAKEKLAEIVGCRAWLHQTVEALPDERLLVRVRGAELNPEKWSRREWALQAICDVQGRMIKATYHDSAWRPGEQAKLWTGPKGVKFTRISRRGKRSVEVPADQRPTVPASVLCMLPAISKTKTITLREIDWSNGNVHEERLERKEGKFVGNETSIDLDKNGRVRELSIDSNRLALIRTKDEIALLRAKAVQGGAFRFGFAKAAKSSLRQTKNGYTCAALGLRIKLPGSWTQLPPATAAPYTLLGAREGDSNAVLQLSAMPLDSRTTLQQFAAPKTRMQFFQDETTQKGKPKNIRLAGRKAQLVRLTRKSWGRDFEVHEIRQVRDGVGYLLRVTFPAKNARDGRSLVGGIRRGWRFD